MRTTFGRPKRSRRLARSRRVEGLGGSARLDQGAVSILVMQNPIPTVPRSIRTTCTGPRYRGCTIERARRSQLYPPTVALAGLLEGEDALPIVFHADHRPISRFRLVH